MVQSRSVSDSGKDDESIAEPLTASDDDPYGGIRGQDADVGYELAMDDPAQGWQEEEGKGKKDARGRRAARWPGEPRLFE